MLSFKTDNVELSASNRDMLAPTSARYAASLVIASLTLESAVEALLLEETLELAAAVMVLSPAMAIVVVVKVAPSAPIVTLLLVALNKLTPLKSLSLIAVMNSSNLVNSLS